MLDPISAAKIAAATVRLSNSKGNSQGVLIPGNMILTAAHCIDWTSDGGMVLGDHFIEHIVAGGRRLKASPLAVEPCADVAILGALDGHAFFDEEEAFESFCAHTEPVELCESDFEVFAPIPAYILSHKGAWIEAKAQQFNPIAHTLHVTAKEQVEGGTSGGPVVNGCGLLLGVVSFTSETGGECDGGIARPYLTLPPWILRRIRAAIE